VNDELQFHFEMTMRELMANGMTPDDAHKEAERRFGDVQRTRERLTTIDRSRVGRERRAEWWSAFAQDFHYALRGLRLKPGFALAVIATLGLGIGANATMFGIVDRLLFRPPRFLVAPDRASRLYFVTTDRGKEDPRSDTGYQHYLDLKNGTTSFEAMTPFYYNDLAVGAGDATKTVHVGVSGADLWRMFDIKPVVGRFFTEQENAPPDGSPVVVLSYAFWQTEFGGRASAIGLPLQIGAVKYTIIGVVPEGFNGFETESLVAFIPISARMAGQRDWYKTYRMSWFDLFARRKAGVAPDAAAADLNRAYQQSYKKQADASRWTTRYEIAKPRAFAGPVLEDRGPNEGSDAKVATWLVGVAGMVLLIACANVANLLLARALKRRREIAVRIALGVSRARLLMQLITESLMLAVLGGLAGLAIAQWGGGIMRRTLLAQAGGSPNAFTDSRLLIFAAALVVIVGLLTGLVPAFQAGRQDVASALKAGAREGTVHRSRIRGALLVGQAALSVVLLVGAGLFLRSLEKVQHVRMGYDADRLMWVSLNARGAEFDSIQSRQLRERLRERAQSIPGIEHAARALNVPFRSTYESVLYVVGIDSVSKLGRFTLQAVDADFFSTMGTRLLRGRAITADDRATSPRVMVVGESMAKKLWPTEDAIGKCVRVASDTVPCTTVVGIAEDVRRGSMRETQMHYYLSIDQHQPSEGVIFLRTNGPAAAKTDEVRRALQQLMPGASYIGVTPMSSVLASQTRSWKMGAVMFAVFGALALVLAAIGLYSVIAYSVTQRTHEMGVRVALGAQSRDVIGLVVREGLRVVVPGVALGAIIALVAGKWVAPLLFDVSPKDPPVMVTVIVTLLVVALAASWTPALRAARVDPNEALRAD
jgi:putative ABC transport system permease protein